MSGQKGTFLGTAKKVENYLKSKVGETLTLASIRKPLNLSTDNSGVYGKVNSLEKAGKVKFIPGSRPVEIQVLNSILDGSEKTADQNTYTANEQNEETRHSFFPSQSPVIQTDIQKAFRNDVEQAASLDIAETMSRVIAVNEQNKTLRAALENIVLILDQVGIIEKSN